MRKKLNIGLIWLMLLIVFFLAGNKPLQADLPACKGCPCKEMIAWRTLSSEGVAGAYALGYKRDDGGGVLTPVQWAVWLSSPQSDACPDNVNTGQNDGSGNTYREYRYVQTKFVCDYKGSSGVIIQDSPSDTAAGSDQGFKYTGRNTCVDGKKTD